jgi:peptidoglycan/LPS O-acetylase OafA/YrhL
MAVSLDNPTFIAYAGQPRLLARPRYRPDIDGLRAVAVLAVIAFHAFPDQVNGGFVGVDIFFVISGFLISSIIFGNLDRNFFSFWQFYARRIRRIFPALILVSASSLAFGWFALLTDEYKQLGKHVAGAAGFIANFVFWREAGYFDNAASTKPLLHLWSLGVEEQFYLVWPSLLWVAWKARINFRLVATIIVFFSIGFNIQYGIAHDAVADFYSPVTRFWELLLGALLAYGRSTRSNLNPRALDHLSDICDRFGLRRCLSVGTATFDHIKSILGGALIAFAIVFISDKRFFPGWWAILPTVGTYLLLSAGPLAIFNRVLSNRLLVWLGLVSYPLYLWHWPVLSFARIVNQAPPSPEFQTGALLASFVLAVTTYWLMERPIQRSDRYGGMIVFLLSIVMAGMGYSGYSVFKHDGIESRAVVQLNPIFNTGNEGDAAGLWVRGCGYRDTTTFETCRIDKSGTANYAIFGDSKTSSLCPGLIRESYDRMKWLCIGGSGINGAAIPVISNDPIYNGPGADPKGIRYLAADALATNPAIRVVVLTTASRVLYHLKSDSSIEDLPESKYGDIAFTGLDRMVEKLVDAGKKVVITIDNPTLLGPLDCMARTTAIPIVNKLFGLKNKENCSISYDRQVALSQNYRDMLSRLQTKHLESLQIFDPTEALCDMKARRCSSSMNGRLLYEHSDHISDYGATLVARKLIPMIEEFDARN